MRNIFYLITWELKTFCQWNLTSWCHFTKGKFLSGYSIKTATWKLVPGTFVFAKNLTQPLLKMKFSKQYAYIRYVITKLSKFVKISMHTFSDSFLQRILWKLGLGISFQATFFIKKNLIKNFLLWYYINCSNCITRLCLLL